MQAWRTLLIGLALLLCSQAQAQNCGAIEAMNLQDSYAAALEAQFALGCFSIAQNASDPLVQAYDAVTGPVGTDIAARVAAFADANRLLREHAETMASSATADRDLWVAVALQLAAQANAIDAARNASDAAAIRRLSANAIHPDTWELDVNTGNVRALPRPAFAGLAAHCPPSTAAGAANCAAYRERKALLRLIVLGRNLTAYNDRGILYVHLAESRIANRQWDAYFNEARFQWWWEVWLNGRRMLKSDGCDSNQSTPQRDGFCAVPNSQLIFLHPDLALSWADGADSSDELDAAFYVELFGYNRWDWSDDGRMQRARGWSVIASYSDQLPDERWGYGLMFHYRNRYSVAVTSTDGEVGVLLSLDLSDQFFERKQKYRNYLQTLNKPDFWREVFTAD